MISNIQNPDHICIFLNKTNLSIDIKGIGDMLPVSLPQQASLIISACAITTQNRLADRLILNPGYYRGALERAKPSYTNENDLLNHQLETLETFVGKISDYTTKWWLSFMAEQKHNPGLVNNVLFELQARNASLEEFFLAFVGSHTNNIAGVIYYMEYLRAILKMDPEEQDPYVKSAIDRMLPEIECDFAVKSSGTELPVLWKKLIVNSKNWNSLDCFALIELHRNLNSGKELLRLCALAQSVRPLALYYYYMVLTLQDAHLINLLRCEPEYYAERYAPHAKYLEICMQSLFDKLEIPTSSVPPVVSIEDLENLKTQYQYSKTSCIPRRLLDRLSTADLSANNIERIYSALNFNIDKQTIIKRVKSHAKS